MPLKLPGGFVLLEGAPAGRSRRRLGRDLQPVKTDVFTQVLYARCCTRESAREQRRHDAGRRT